jgi:hypothetical protein
VHIDGDGTEFISMPGTIDKFEITVGMFVGTYTMRISPSGKRGQSAFLDHTAYIQAEPPKPPPRKEPRLHTGGNDKTNRSWQTEDRNDESLAGGHSRAMSTGPRTVCKFCISTDPAHSA